MESGCLYNLGADPTEHDDLAVVAAHGSIMAQLFEKLQHHNATTFTPDRGAVDPAACAATKEVYGGFWGPWVK